MQLLHVPNERLSDDLELALDKLWLEVKGTDAEDNLDVQTQEEFSMIDTPMELSDNLIIWKGTFKLAKTKKQREISKEAMYVKSARRNVGNSVQSGTAEYCCYRYAGYRQATRGTTSSTMSTNT